MTEEMLQKVETAVTAALQRIGAEDIPKKVALAVKFARQQPPVPIILDGKPIVAVAVDIATVFSPENSYRQIDVNGTAVKAETVQALSIVLADDDVTLCKSTYDAIPDAIFRNARFVNARYQTANLCALTEKYIC